MKRVYENYTQNESNISTLETSVNSKEILMSHFFIPRFNPSITVEKREEYIIFLNIDSGPDLTDNTPPVIIPKLHSKRVKMKTTLKTSEDENYTRNE